MIRKTFALLLCAACARSMHAAPPLESLAEAPTASASELLVQADAAWARRADPEQAAKAEALYLQAARAKPSDAATYSGAIRAKAFRIGRERDASARLRLAEGAVAVGERCQAELQEAPPCDYWLAAALGLQARERSATAHDALPHIVALLRRAEKNAPDLDRGGPSRLLAILFLRAPGWPLGPGDPEEALIEAKAAVRVDPGYAPNQLALGEALRKNGHAQEARVAYAQALRLADAAGSSDPDALGWAEDAQKALH
jgi:hypothetical protein